MSENLKRSNLDFSKYDSMSIGELEEILRADATGPERDDSDVEEILYVMEVLAKKRRQNGIAGKTALEAYQEFQQHYLPVVEAEEDIESVPKRKATAISLRWIAAIAASLVLVFTLTTSVTAFGWKDIWNAVARWAEETFSFSEMKGNREPFEKDVFEYSSLQEALAGNGRNASICPSWTPAGFELEELIIDRNPLQETYFATYSNGELRLKISIQSFLSGETEQIEMSSQAEEIYSVQGIDFYIFDNHGQRQVAWVYDIYECYFSGELSNEEIKLMIDSIGKG